MLRTYAFFYGLFMDDELLMRSVNYLYARELVALAVKLGLSQEYVQRIRAFEE